MTLLTLIVDNSIQRPSHNIAAYEILTLIAVADWKQTPAPMSNRGLVRLNVYDLAEQNAYLYWAGVGIFHSGVEVYGVEFAYGEPPPPPPPPPAWLCLALRQLGAGRASSIC